MSIIPPFGPNTVCSFSEMYAAQVWHLFCCSFSGTPVPAGPAHRKNPLDMLVMLGLQRDRVPEVKAFCLAKMSVHTQSQHHTVPKFRQYNVPVHCPVQTKQLELHYWQLLWPCSASLMPVVGISLLVVEQPDQSADVDVASVAGVSANMT